MSAVVLNNPFEGNRTLSQNQIKSYEKAYRELKSEIITDDKETSAKQTQKLKQALQYLQDIKKKAETYRVQCEEKVRKLKEVSAEYQKKIDAYHAQFKHSNKEEDYKSKISAQQKQYVENCKKRVEIANTIDTTRFLKLSIDERKSQANEVFKWIITAIYCEPQGKYYWPNFKEQAFEEDKGLDLKERLGKVNAFNSTQEQRIKSTNFIKQFDKTIKAPQFVGFESEINKIHQIAKLFLSSAEIGKRVKEYQKLIQKSRTSSLKGDEQNLQVKSNNDAVKERIRVSEAYIHQLGEMERLLNDKFDNYNKEITMGDSYTSQMNKISSFTNSWVLPEDKDSEKRGTCQCTIF